MGFARHTVVLAFLGILQLSLGFVRLDTTAQPQEHPTRATVQNSSLRHLSSEYLKSLYTDLSSLKISKSRIDSIDSDAFDYLNHLNLLEISDSEISSEINPNTFSGLPGLEILVLKNINMRRVNLNLTHVQQLVLARNQIETIEGSSIVGKEISHLDLSENKLRALEGTFANLSKLSTIDLSKNKLSEIGPAFEDNVNLLRVWASENSIASTEGLRLPWLKNLDLFFNKMQTLDPTSFSKMAALEELVLAFNNIKHIDDAFRDLIELKFLNLAWNHIEELQPHLFRNNLYLTELSLQGNKLKSLDKFHSVHHHLTHLDLSHNLLTLVHDDFFASTPNLLVLDLSFNRLKTLRDALRPLPQLQHLNLAYNDLSMTAYDLSNNPHLTALNLSSNALQRGLSLFKHNQLLKVVDVSSNDISDFCDEAVAMKSLQKVNLSGNLIRSLECLREFKALCEVDLRHNPLVCGEELDALIQNLAERRRSPYKMAAEWRTYDECEKLSLNRSLALWNSVKRELCPKGQDLPPPTAHEWDASDDDSDETDHDAPPHRPTAPPNNPKKQFLVVPIGWIGNDEMNKPNPMQSPQSERSSWEKIDENAELLKDLEEEDNEDEPGRKNRFSWYTIALILIGFSLSLTCLNLVVFFYIRLKVWKRSDASSPQKYTFLHNEVYKNTTEPSKVASTADSEWIPETQMQNKIFSYGKINEFLLNFGLPKKDKDSESAKNILISPNGSLNC